MTPEKKWLDEAVHDYIVKRSVGMIGVFEGDVLEEYAPTHPFRKLYLTSENAIFGARERKVQKAMVEASMRRLIAAGRIAIAKYVDRLVKGKREVERVPLFKPITLLDALADVAS